MQLIRTLAFATTLLLATSASLFPSQCHAQDGFSLEQNDFTLFLVGNSNNSDDQIRFDMQRGPKGNIIDEAVSVTVNGEEFQFTGVYEIFVTAGNGNNIISFANGFTLPGTLRIEAGNDDDFVMFDNASIGGNLDIILRGGDNSLAIGSTHVGLRFLFESLGGNDKFNSMFYPTGAGRQSGLSVERDATIKTGGGADQVNLAQCTFGKNLRLDTGTGFDTATISSDDPYTSFVSPTTIERNCVIAHNGFGGLDMTVSGSEFGSNLYLLTRSGDDSFTIHPSSTGQTTLETKINGHVIAYTGSGKDTVSSDGLNMKNGNFFVRTQAGYDTVSLLNSTFLNLNIDLGTEEDVLEIDYSMVLFGADLDGGAGEDTGNVLNIDAGAVDSSNFEFGNLAN